MSLSHFRRDFEEERRAKGRIYMNRAQSVAHFFASNDAFPLPEILSSSNSTTEAKTESKDTITLVVGEADVISILDKIEGDVIVCDVDATLLEFVDNNKTKLLDLFGKLEAKTYSFEQVVNEYHQWLEAYEKYDYDWLGSIKNLTIARKGLVGKFHFLHSEENFKKAMTALRQKQLVTLHINLFDTESHECLINQLNKNKKTVKRFNLSNLPDYDCDNTLTLLLKNIPWAQNSEIIWNHIDTAGSSPMVHRQTHYLFRADSHSQYSTQIDNIPAFSGAIDRITLPKQAKTVEPMPRRRYDIDETGHYSYNPQKRSKYLHSFSHTSYTTVPQICQSFGVAYPPRTGSHFYSSYHEAICVSQIPYISSLLEKLTDNEINQGILGPLKIEFKNFYEQYPASVNENPQKAKDFLRKARFVGQLMEQLNQVKTTLDAKYQKSHSKVLTETCQILNNQLLDCYNNFNSEVLAKKHFRESISKSILANHRGFNTQQHNVLRNILNTFLCIPILGQVVGVTKYFVTGSFWFYEKNYRERLVDEKLNNIINGPMDFVQKKFRAN